ncbi:MAG: carbon-nitrogen hydrolase family protein [Proteobacteria bacterium]|nr:carbon-nitrogen hydrolase family protein [Pseudomonadota bacterium]
MINNTTNILRLLACQLKIPVVTTVDERDLHLQKTAEKIRAHLSEKPADLVILPELSSVDYARDTFDQLNGLAETDFGASFQVFSKIAKEYGVTVVYGYPGRQNKQYTICQAAVGPDGQLLGVYEKLHIAHYGASMEKDYFRRGQNVLVFEHRGIRIAPIICYDIRFSGLCQTLATKHETEIILHCGAYFRDESFTSWHPFAITRAMENQVYLLSLNRAGEDYGQSILCPPWMDEEHPCEAFEKNSEDFRYLNLDMNEITRAREFPFLKDRLDDYEGLPA